MLTRRDFIAELAVSGAAMATMATAPAGIFSVAQSGARVSVVSIHMDQPYIDATGNALPYVPPDGVCGGAPVEDLSEAVFRTCQIYL